MKSKLLLAALVAVLFSVSPSVQAKNFELDLGHTKLGFEVSHLVVATVEGRFDKFSGYFDFDEATGKLAGLVINIDTGSINTNEPNRDKHLKGDEFFNAEKHPKIIFKSTSVTYKDSKPNSILGTLNMAGVTKPVTLAVDYRGKVKDPWGNEKLVFNATTKIKRKDWGIVWNKALDTGGFAVGDEVIISIKGQASHKPKK